MKILKSNLENKELPIKINISFKKVYDYLEAQANNSQSVLQPSATKLLAEVNNYPFLKEGFSDSNLLKTYEHQIEKLLSILFPDLLQSNEIKAATIPFDMTSFMLSKRFSNIIKNAGPDYVFGIRNFDKENIYILTCVYILSFYYNVHMDFKRPFFFDIPDNLTNTLKTYKALINADFSEITKTSAAPDLNNEDFKTLMNNFENIDVWKEKFPPNSYLFNGFGLINLFDVTQDEILSNIKNTFIKRDKDGFEQLEKHLKKLYGFNHLKLGLSAYNKTGENLSSYTTFFNEFSLINSEVCHNLNNLFCSGILNRVFSSSNITAITDIEAYGKNEQNLFYKTSIKKGIKSIILVPIELNNNYLAILEIGSPNTYELNSINANKLKDIIPALSIAVERSIDERHNLLESVIQENYTAIHPSVKWKFYNAADEHISKSTEKNTLKLKDVCFKSVYPIYGQCDVKGSSDARNLAIQEDLSYQLQQTIILFQKIHEQEPLIAYKQIIHRLQTAISGIKHQLKTTDELQITDLLQNEIYPVLEHVKSSITNLKSTVENYQKTIDPDLKTVYKKRKAYEDFIAHLNSSLAKHLDKAQTEAQDFFPHYYERFKTDGLDYNMYIGESIAPTKNFNNLYVKNLRLWQLQQQCELEYIAKQVDVEHPEISLQVTSLILVHSQPLNIKFRMDEKKFDVDGAYNMRYEIIKKRIDKSYIKGTNERLTQAGKIAIVYSYEQDLTEYLTYIDYLKKQNYFYGTIEFLDIEELQGVSGLKAIRVKINYNRTNQDDLSFKNLLKATKLML